MTILDKPEEFKKVDKNNLLKSIEEFPAQCLTAWEEVKQLPVPSYFLGVKKVIITGMGGSAIGGDMVKSYIARESKVPIFVLRDYELPAFIDRDSLVIAISYSGNTEETLSIVSEALKRRTKIIAITTNGDLQKVAQGKKFPFYKFTYPTEPRQAFGFLFTALLGILNKMTIIDVKDEEFKEIIILLKALNTKIKKDVPASENEAKKIATKVYKKFPVIFGSDCLKPVAFRFKTQLNENSKQVAVFEELPEACHNFIAGLDNPPKLGEKIFCLLLISKYAHPRNKVRYKVVEEILSNKKIPHETLIVEPAPSVLAEILSFVYLLDYASFYTSILNKADPKPIPNIDYLKKRLKELS